MPPRHDCLENYVFEDLSAHTGEEYRAIVGCSMFVTFFKDGNYIDYLPYWRHLAYVQWLLEDGLEHRALRSVWSLRMHVGTLPGPMAFFGLSLWSSLMMPWLDPEILCIWGYGILPRSGTVDMSSFLKILEYCSLRIVAFPLGVVSSLLFVFLERSGGISTWSLLLTFMALKNFFVGFPQSSSNKESMYLLYDALMSCLRASWYRV